MEKKKMFIIILLLFAAVFVAGCVGGTATTIKNDEQAVNTTTGIADDVDNIGNIMSDIDTKLG